jgi:hypothetical protein
VLVQEVLAVVELGHKDQAALVHLELQILVEVEVVLTT